MRASFSLGFIMRKLAALLFLCLASPLLWANTLDDIRFAELPGDRFEVRMSFAQRPPEPTGYAIESPARIVLDFPGVESRLPERRYPLAFESGRTAVVLTSEGRTRLVINLASPATYTSRVEDNTYIVEVDARRTTVQRDTRAEILDLSEVVSTAATDRRGPSVRDIDFRRGVEGEGRVIIALSTPNVGVNLADTATGVRLTLTDVYLPAELRRRLDVVDFATPVSQVAARFTDNSAVLDIAASGNYDYLAYQTDTQYVLSIKPLTPREVEARRDEFSFTGDRLSLSFQDIEVRAVLQLIADFTELNLVASDTVTGRITLRLDGVPWDQALDLVLKTKGLDKRVVGNVMMVAPAHEIAERERQELSTRRQLEELAPLRTEYIRVNYANAADLFELFTASAEGAGQARDRGTRDPSAGRVLSSRGSAIVDERTNSIIVTDTSDRIEALRRLIEQLDIPVRQVMIEARVVIARTDFSRAMGVRWGGVGANLSSNALFEVGGSTQALTPGASPADFLYGSAPLNLQNNMMVDLGVSEAVGSIAFGLLTDNAFLDLELSALEQTGLAEIVSQPKVITGDKSSATISTGIEIPYEVIQATGGMAMATVEWKDVLLKMDVTPQITPDNRIIMSLQINKDTLTGFFSGATGTLPIVAASNLNTNVLVADGETLVLGGVFQVEQLQDQDKVPLLGDIPFLGRLFRRDIQSQNKEELIIFITPRIMADSLTN